MSNNVSNEQLVIRIKAGINISENMLQLYQQTKGFIKLIAWRYRDSGELEDLEQEGYLALYPAIDHFNPDRGVKFLTYAGYYITQRMQDYLRENASCLRIPKGCREKIERYQKYCKAYYLECGRWPSNREAADYMGLSVEQVENIRDYAYRKKLESLDSPVTDNEGDQKNTKGDFIPDEKVMDLSVIEHIDHERLSSFLWKYVDEMPGTAPNVIRQRYQREKTFIEIGKDLGISWNEVRNIHDKALRQLRKPETSNHLRYYLPDVEQAYIMGLQGGGVEHFHRTWTSSTERAALELYQSGRTKRE